MRFVDLEYLRDYLSLCRLIHSRNADAQFCCFTRCDSSMLILIWSFGGRSTTQSCRHERSMRALFFIFVLWIHFNCCVSLLNEWTARYCLAACEVDGSLFSHWDWNNYCNIIYLHLHFYFPDSDSSFFTRYCKTSKKCKYFNMNKQWILARAAD